MASVSRRVIVGGAFVGIVALLAVGALFRTRSGPAVRGPIVLISIDTLRADRLPAYGHSRVRTPALDQLAADAILFERAYAHSPQTLPSHASILSGRLPFEHGARDNVGFTVRPDVPTLPELLARAGFGTAAFVSSYVLRSETGVGRGFAVYDDELPPVSPEAGVGLVQREGLASLAAAERWLNARDDSRFLLFFHIYEPHTPYAPPERYAHYDPYDGEIALADEIIGRLLQSLRSRARYDDALIVLLSDHGEGLGDHGEEEHGIFLYDEAIRVPLMVKLPRQRGAGRRTAEPVQHVDLVPTILDLAGVAVPTRFRGRSLRPLLMNGDTLPETGIYSETYHPRYQFGWSELRALTAGRFRFISAPREELYDLRNDPHERTNLVSNRAATTTAMRAALEQITRGAEAAEPSPISDEARRRLQALGYVGSSPATASGTPATSLPDPKDRVGMLAEHRRAIRLAGERRFGEAIRGFQTIVRDQPSAIGTWQMLGEVLVRAGRYREAADAYERAMALRPEAASAVGAASALLAADRPREAQRAAEQALVAAPASEPRTLALAYQVLVSAALALGDEAAARQHAARAAEIASLKPLADYVDGLIHYRHQRYADALASFERALRDLRPPVQFTELHFHTADTLARLERYEEAERHFREELRVFPHNLRARATLVTLYEATGRRREAAREIDRLIDIAPTAEGYALAARLWTMFGEPARAASVRHRTPR